MMQSRAAILGLCGALLLSWCVGMFGRGYWTPDEPREADIAWRMSGQGDKAVPMLAGEPFCEKPPLTYWLAAVPISLFGSAAWAARLPNLIYAIMTALAVGLLTSRSAGRYAGWVAAATISTFLLAYQVEIWLATDAPLLAAVSISLLGAYLGFYAVRRKQRLGGYVLMHTALALGFLSKSAVAWMVPALAIVTLALWERRWRELIRWELYAGLVIQAAVVLTWVWFVYSGADGLQHLKVFFWNNLIGRFMTVDAPAPIQYAAGHKNSPGKYLIELPLYLFPWTFLVTAAARRAWRQRRHLANDDGRTIRFAVASSLPTLLVLSLAATARNIYLAPALPGVALLLGWWAREILSGPDAWEVHALRATTVMLLLGVIAFVVVLTLVAGDSWSSIDHASFVAISAAGLLIAAWLAVRAWSRARVDTVQAKSALFLAYCALLVVPASQLYPRVDRWQDLSTVSREIQIDAGEHQLILLAPDETTRAVIDLYAPRPALSDGTPTLAPNVQSARQLAGATGVILVQLPKGPMTVLTRLRHAPASTSETMAKWIAANKLQVWREYSVPNGRRYALLRNAP